MYYRDVYQFLLFFTGDEHSVEDLTQEVFMKVLKALPQFDERASLKTWILHIAKNVAIDQHRRKRLSVVFGNNLLKLIPAAKDRQPEEAFQAKEEKEYIESAILKLKPKYRMIVILRGVKEYSVKETAEILGCSEAKVKVDFHRAIKMLQQKLQTYMRGGQDGERTK
ncbi:RNA polymerase subunit sigma-70 [Brevibacillus laterosporus]|nr:RNA polymerase subunit sigma-70 [Brevibacillus laterosporus]PPB13208.1 RNA polymerase subunit sigma-70 [Brevibacillus laterosporus]